MVEMRRIELLTPCLQGRCSPSWATPPYWLHLLPGFLDSVDECWPFQMSFHCDAYFSFVRLIRSPGIRKNMVGLTRLELVTSRLSGVRSNQLSYKPIFEIFRFHPDLPHAVFPEPSEQVPRSRESSYASTSASISGSELPPISASFVRAFGKSCVEMKRFELSTPCLQGRCSPNWATPPT